jgi:2-dehydro-3-deoxygluconokinase
MRVGIEAMARQADIVLPSFDEEAAVFGDPTPEDTIARYRALGAEAVVVKNGADPIVAWSKRDGSVSVPIASLEVVDSTAAGDSFAGTYLAASLTGHPMRDSIERAAEVSGLVIRAHGALIDEAVIPVVGRSTRPN